MSGIERQDARVGCGNLRMSNAWRRIFGYLYFKSYSYEYLTLRRYLESGIAPLLVIEQNVGFPFPSINRGPISLADAEHVPSLSSARASHPNYVPVASSPGERRTILLFEYSFHHPGKTRPWLSDLAVPFDLVPLGRRLRRDEVGLRLAEPCTSGAATTVQMASALRGICDEER